MRILNDRKTIVIPRSQVSARIHWGLFFEHQTKIEFDRNRVRMGPLRSEIEQLQQKQLAVS